MFAFLPFLLILRQSQLIHFLRYHQLLHYPKFYFRFLLLLFLCKIFYNHLWLKVRRAGWTNVKSKRKGEKYPQKTGFTMAVEVHKSKQSIPHQVVRIPFDFRTQLDEVGAIVLEAMDYGLIESRGSYYDLDGHRFQGKAALLDYVRDKPDTVERLAKALADREEETNGAAD